MNYKTIKSTLKSAGLTLAGITLGYLAFAQIAQAEGIKEHRIGKAYGITAEQLMPMMSQDSLTAKVDSQKVTISTKDFLKSLLEMNVVEAASEELYNNLSQHRSNPLDAIGFGVYSAKGMDGKGATYAHDGPSSMDILSYCKSLGLTKNGFLSPMRMSDDEALMEVGDRVFPKKLREKRNGAFRLCLDREESYILGKMIYQAFKENQR